MPALVPFDLDSFIFTPNDDEVIIDETVDIDDASDPMIAAIITEGPVDALSGNDQIEGVLSGTYDTGAEKTVSGIYNFFDIETGEGRDRILGEVNYSVSEAGAGEGGFFGIASGGGGSPSIFTGDDNDSVIGKATVQGVPGRVAGINDASIFTGDGRDEVKGIVEVDLSAAPAVRTEGHFGIGGSAIATGDGNDQIMGSADFTLGDGQAAVGISGIGASLIESGSGRDTVMATATVAGGDASGAFAVIGFGSFAGGASLVDLGEGNDKLIGETHITLGADAAVQLVFGLAGEQVLTGPGRDNIAGSVEVEVGDGSEVINAVGLIGSIDTGDGNDNVLGTVAIQTGADSSAVQNYGIIEGVITTGAGRDRVEGIAIVEGDDPFAEDNVGISASNIDTGDNNDTVIGTGGSVGIEDSQIFLGSGDDKVVARGNGGGIDNTDIFGQDGDDIFDLQRGDGLVDGGADDDLLILAGNKEDFDFVAGGPGGVTIIRGLDELEVVNVERFQFDDGTCDFDELGLLFP